MVFSFIQFMLSLVARFTDFVDFHMHYMQRHNVIVKELAQKHNVAHDHIKLTINSYSICSTEHYQLDRDLIDYWHNGGETYLGFWYNTQVNAQSKN